MNHEQRKKFAAQNKELQQKISVSIKYQNEQRNRPPEPEEPTEPPTEPDDEVQQRPNRPLTF
jgi:hypothetical protein